MPTTTIQKWTRKIIDLKFYSSVFCSFKSIRRLFYKRQITFMHCSKSLQSYLTLCDPMDYSPPGSSVHGILQARIPEWLWFPSPGHLPDPGINPHLCGSCTAGSLPLAPPVSSVQSFSLIWFWDPMDCSMPGFPVHHQLPELAQNLCPSSQGCHLTILSSVFPVSSCLQSFPAPGSFLMSQFFVSGGQSWSFSFSISPSNKYPGLISFRMDWFNLLAVQGTLKSLLQHHSSKASILQRSAFFMVQFSHPCTTTGKTIALTIQTFVDISLLLNGKWQSPAKPAYISAFNLIVSQEQTLDSQPLRYRPTSWLCELQQTLLLQAFLSLFFLICKMELLWEIHQTAQAVKEWH